jgi:hypothetical protein
MNNFKRCFSISRLAGIVLACSAVAAEAQPTLGTAAQFAVLGGTNVTCTAGLVVTGDIGVSPGSAVPFTNTGCTITGATPPATNAAAALARAAFLNAYSVIQLTPACVPVAGNLSAASLVPGVYCLDATAKAGTLTLNGPASGVWIFLVNGALTGTNFSVLMAGGGLPCNVYWAMTGATTLTTSSFKGNILAGNSSLGSITLTGGTLAGRALASVAVTLTGASVIGCAALGGGGNGGGSCGDNGHSGGDKDHKKCNQGVGNGGEDCDPGHSDGHHNSNDESGGKPGSPGRKGGE